MPILECPMPEKEGFSSMRGYSVYVSGKRICTVITHRGIDEAILSARFHWPECTVKDAAESPK